MKRISWLFAGSVALIGLSVQALAVDKPRADYQGAVGMCKAALPSFNVSLRNRPLGIANESSSDVYITCNWQGDDSQFSTRGATKVSVVISNNSQASQTVACTLVNGFQHGSTNTATFTPKTVAIAAGTGASIEWVPADIAGAPTLIKLPALSCMLPGGTTLQYTTREYNEDVGA